MEYLSNISVKLTNCEVDETSSTSKTTEPIMVKLQKYIPLYAHTGISWEVASKVVQRDGIIDFQSLSFILCDQSKSQTE